MVAPDELGRRAAQEVAGAARGAVEARGRCALALSGGSTPVPMLETLAGLPLPWADIHVLQVDERVAPEGHPDRNLGRLAAHLLERAPLPAGNVHPIPVADGDPEAVAARYAATLVEVCGDPPVIDLAHLGLGSDGHTASLIPGDPVLEVDDREVAATGPYQGRRRITLTVPCLNRARRLVYLVDGASKAGAVRQLVAADPAIPAGRLDQGRAMLLAAPSAAAELDSP